MKGNPSSVCQQGMVWAIFCSMKEQLSQSPFPFWGGLNPILLKSVMDCLSEWWCHSQDRNGCLYFNSLCNQVIWILFIVVLWKSRVLEESGNHAVHCAEHSSDPPKGWFSFQCNSINIKPLLSATQETQLASHVWAAYLSRWSSLRWCESGNNSCNQ